MGIRREVLDAILGHVHAGVTGRHYDKCRFEPEVRGALEEWDRALQRIVGGQPGKVVKLARTIASCAEASDDE